MCCSERRQHKVTHHSLAERVLLFIAMRRLIGRHSYRWCMKRSASTTTAGAEEVCRMPPWLLLEMKTNHAGEYGAVQIYHGAYYGLKLHEQLNVFIDEKRDAMKVAFDFVEKHRKAEEKHLEIIESFIQPSDRTKLIPLWHLSAFMLGLLPSIFGQRALYWTIASVESFVEEHYNDQINRLRREGDPLPNIRQTLQLCCEDEIEHKDEAVAALLVGVNGRLRDLYDDETLYDDLLQKSAAAKAWTFIVDKGSRVAVQFSKKY